MADIITTLHPENDAETNLYPNIKQENIPNGSINRNKLDDEVNNLLNQSHEQHVDGVSTSEVILAFTSDKGIWIGSDTGYWYYWDGTQYVSGGVYQATQVADNTINFSMLTSNLYNFIKQDKKYNYDVSNGYINADGSLQKNQSNAYERRTNYIPVNVNDVIRYNLTYLTSHQMWIAYCLYDEDLNAVGTRVTILDNARITYEDTLTIENSNAKYIIFAYRSWNESDMNIYLSSSFYNVLSKSFTYTNFNFKDGYYNADGSWNPVHQNGEKTSNDIYPLGYDIMEIIQNIPESQYMWIAVNIYYKDGTFSRNVTDLASGTQLVKIFNVTNNIEKFSISIRTYTYSNTMNFRVLTRYYSVNDYLNNLSLKIAELNTKLENNKSNTDLNSNIFRFNKYYDHIFIDKSNGVDVIIPSESLFNIQISKRLGFKIIEANILVTSDNKYIVMHGYNGKFGTQVYHTENVDISDISVNSVTLDYIKTYVRYKSLYEKYQTSIPTLEEFLMECKNNDMIALIGRAYDINVAAIADKILGVGNYIAYMGTRETTQGMIMRYLGYTTKEQIIQECETYGKPFMYCMANPTDFTDEELVEIIDELHSKGYLIGNAGCYDGEVETQRLLKLGFDFSASAWSVNNFESNICNLSADLNYSEFVTTGAVSNNLLTLQENDTVTPNYTLPNVFLGMGYLSIKFKGSINVTMGHRINNTFTSNGEETYIFSTYYLNAVPTFTITANSETEIININFKASKV